MKSFKDFLIEMSVDAALKLFGFNNSSISKIDLTKKYKALSKKNHPDLGGSTEQMQKINAAYETLKKSSGNTTKQDDFRKSFDKMAADYRNYAKIAMLNLEHRINIKNFQKYFSAFLDGKDIKVEINKTDITKFNDRSSPTDVYYEAQFYTTDKKINFTMRFSVTLVNIAKEKATLGSSNIDFPMFVSINILYNRRKVKLGAKDYNFSSDKNIMSDPEILFPKAKLKKVFTAKTKKFAKKDALLSLKKELDARITGDDIRIDFKTLGKFASLYMYRSTFMRLGTYNIVSLTNGKSHHRFKVQTIMEGEEQISFIIDTLKKLQTKKKESDIVKGIEKMLKDIGEMNK